MGWDEDFSGKIKMIEYFEHVDSYPKWILDKGRLKSVKEENYSAAYEIM